MAIETKKFVCGKCGNDCSHITEIYNSVGGNEDYPDSGKLEDFGFRQGYIGVKIHCETCNSYSWIIIGEHKGEVFFEKVDRTDYMDADDGSMELVDYQGGTFKQNLKYLGL